MTWKPIGPEQMDGEKYVVGWDEEPEVVEMGVFVAGDWVDVRELRPFAISPTHYLPGVRPLGEDEELQNEKTVRVRVAAVVSNDGTWNACGGSWAKTDVQAMSAAIEGLYEDGERRSWITADLPIPQVKEIAGRVDSQ